MGADLRDIIEKKEIELKELFGKTIAIDAYNTLYQFLSIIRQPDGTPLMDSQGNITSHLSGLLYRTTNLIESGIKPVFVFDGKPPEFKAQTIRERAEIRDVAERRWITARTLGEEDAFKYAQASSKLDSQIVGDAKTILGYMGIPCVQAPSEGEAQAAFMAINGDADAVSSQDYDALLFGAPKLVRNLTITGRRKLPGKNIYIDVKPEMLELNSILDTLNITSKQLIDIAILIGTDYNDGIKGIGPKTALRLIQKHGAIEGALAELNESVESFDTIRESFLYPEITATYEIDWEKPKEALIIKFLCDQHDFSEERVEKVLERLIEASAQKQKTLDQWSRK
ncbi:MAG: flap endonuclease-1 [Methanocellales archaeon]|nr:flap endonuclease-1 [Methanocellales archaeon]MDD3291557.1 flap endonuclease-1 [Methanocellales archaeon]MDD5235846.1 flap endonuclease-1 [Methanocellales archaeon]MDD5485339.1 flap endonuclease-1 [Methanocellales archaeon]